VVEAGVVAGIPTVLAVDGRGSVVEKTGVRVGLELLVAAVIGRSGVDGGGIDAVVECAVY
jgi:hypothetical protein